MSNNTIIQQGYFTSTGVDVYIPLRSDFDWVRTVNLTAIADNTQWDSIRHFWQHHMANGDSVVDYYQTGGGTRTISVSTSVVGYNAAVYRGIYRYDSSASMLGAPIAVTAGTNATRPVYSTGTTTDLATGTIVRVWGGAHTNVNGLDFSIDTVVAATSFRLANTLATAPGVVNGAGFYRVVAPNAALYDMFYPSKRVIANITAAASAVVTTLVDHNYLVGQTVKLMVPATCGMTEINGLVGTITAVTASTFTVNINSTAFTAFNYPLPAIVPFTPAEVIPYGDASILGATTLTGATVNAYTMGLMLAGGATCPAGANADVIKWIAGKSFANDVA